MPLGLEEQGGSYWDLASQPSSEGSPTGAGLWRQGFADLAGKESGKKCQLPSPSSFSSPCSAPYWLSPTRSQRPGETEEAVHTGGREEVLAWCGPDRRNEGQRGDLEGQTECPAQAVEETATVPIAITA